MDCCWRCRSALVNSPLLERVAPSLGFYYFAVFAAGLVLAWRFNSSRVLFSLLVLLLAHRAVEFFSAGHARSGPGRTAAVLVALLIPLNYVALALMRERGLTVAGIAPRFGLLFLQSVVVAVFCRPENSSTITSTITGPAISAGLPFWAYSGFAVAIAVLAFHFVQTRKPVETGFLWSLVPVFLWLEFHADRQSRRCLCRHRGTHPRRVADRDFVRAGVSRRTYRHSRPARIQRSAALARPAIRHRHRRYRSLQAIQRHLRTRHRRPGPAHGCVAT